MRIAINSCHGGFGLSKAALKKYWDLKGRKCYFFKHEYKYDKKGSPIDDIYTPVGVPGKREGVFLNVFDIPNPNDVFQRKKSWNKMTVADREAHNEAYRKHILSDNDIERNDPDLIRVIEEMGSEAASGQCAALTIVEVPDGTNWTIEEYDGSEWVAEKHSTWS